MAVLSFSLSHAREFSQFNLAMNTITRISIYSHDNKSLSDAYSLIQSLDNALSMYNSSSDIARVNSMAGIAPVNVHPFVIDAVLQAIRLHDISRGAFNPLIGAVTNLWRINSIDGIIPNQVSLDEAVKLTDIHNIQITSNSIFLRHKGCVLDLGGIAKGFASTKVIEMLRDKGITSGIVDLGGNVHVLGRIDGRNWNIGIRNPLNTRTYPLAVLKVHDTSVITSGNYERYKIIDGKRYSHFFDTKTGQSVMSDLISVTVISPDGSLADGLATALMTLGFHKAVELIHEINGDFGVVLIRDRDNQPEIYATQNLKDIIYADYNVTFL